MEAPRLQVFTKRFRQMSVKNCMLADFLMVLSTPRPISAFQNESSLHSSQLLLVILFGRQCCRVRDVT